MGETGKSLLKCQQDIRHTFTKTLDELLPGLMRKYHLDEKRVRQAIAWAATSVAVENHLFGSDFDEDDYRIFHTHINYLFHGAKNLATDILAEEDESNE